MQNHCMIYGYARVSTDAYDLGRQLTLLTAAGRVTIFWDKRSGVPTGRTMISLVAPMAVFRG
jgi:DNA invertase Pin-like site-specific DNA recombinase